jgi:hypothetical protein
MWSVREADHSPPSSAWVEEGEAVRSLPLRLYGVVLNFLSTELTSPFTVFSQFLFFFQKPKNLLPLPSSAHAVNTP